MFFYPLRYRIYAMVKTLMLNGHGYDGKVDGEMEMVLIMEVEMETINKRDGRTGKDGKLNKRSKMEKWKIMETLTELKDEKSR